MTEAVLNSEQPISEMFLAALETDAAARSALATVRAAQENADQICRSALQRWNIVFYALRDRSSDFAIFAQSELGRKILSYDGEELELPSEFPPTATRDPLR